MRKILYDLDIDSQQFNTLLNNYVKKEIRGLPKAGKSSFKTNLVAALSEPKLQILYFMRFLKLLQPTSVKFTVSLTWRGQPKAEDFSIDLDIVDPTLAEEEEKQRKETLEELKKSGEKSRNSETTTD